jgi:hypothetical protein
MRSDLKFWKTIRTATGDCNNIRKRGCEEGFEAGVAVQNASIAGTNN